MSFSNHGAQKGGAPGGVTHEGGPVPRPGGIEDAPGGGIHDVGPVPRPGGIKDGPVPRPGAM